MPVQAIHLPEPQSLSRPTRMAGPPSSIVLACVAKFFRIDLRHITGPTRCRRVVFARQVAFYLLRKLTNLSFEEIGVVFSNRDHSTVLHGVQKIEKRSAEPDVLACIQLIEMDIEKAINPAAAEAATISKE